MDGQFSIFDYMDSNQDIHINPMYKKDNLCNDEDINQIFFRLRNICINQRFKLGEAKFEVWDHVPNLGYRLSFWVYYGENTKPTDSFEEKILEVIDYAKKVGVELSVCYLRYFGDLKEITTEIMFTTMFKDKRRSKV